LSSMNQKNRHGLGSQFGMEPSLKRIEAMHCFNVKRRGSQNGLI
jgi:hypothetical protein